MRQEAVLTGGKFGRMSKSADRTLLICAVSLSASLLSLILVTYEQRVVLAPLLGILNIALLFALVIWMRDGGLHLLELGTLCVVTSMLYVTIPLLQFLLSGLQWTEIGDNRLFFYSVQNQSPPQTVASIGWRNALYLGCFVVMYLTVCGSSSLRRIRFDVPSWAAAGCISVFLGLTIYMYALQFMYGVNLNPSYDDAVALQAYKNLPHMLKQVTHNLRGVWVTSKLGIVLLLIRKWKNPNCRVLLFVWLTYELISVVINMGARSEAAMLILCAFILYSKSVRPLRFREILVAVLLLVGAILYGIARDFQNGFAAFEYYRHASVWSSGNEFLSMFGTTFDLFMMKRQGIIGEIPWHYYFSDFYALIPSQFLPFEKADVSVIYNRAQGIGQGSVLIGVVGHSVAGYDWVELAIRGAGLGILFGLLHRWYVRRSARFWPTFFYVFLCCWSYYTYRATTLSFLYFIVYRLLPFLVLVQLARLWFPHNAGSRRHGRKANYRYRHAAAT